MDALWPGESPTRLGNRFSVAINVVRRALDPQRIMPTQRFVATDAESVRLDVDTVDIDIERFLSLAPRDDDVSRTIARRLYRGEAFSEEPYADWALALREEAAYLNHTLT
jgi:two-component SAPR family response regulator